MKSIKRMLVSASLLLGLASVGFAGPGVQQWQTLRKESQFKELKAGEKIAQVCNMCHTVTETTVESADDAMEKSKEGAMVTCPMCHKTAKVVRKQSRNDSPTSEVVYVDEKGEECMFMAKVSDKK